MIPNEMEPGRKRTSLVVLVLLILCFLASATKINSYDFWWHAKTGELICETGHIPLTDQYSFTSSGHPRIAHDWLSEVILYLFLSSGGAPLIVILKALIITLGFFLSIRYLMNRAVPMGIVTLCIILSLWGSRFRFMERPELFSLLFTAIVLFLLYEAGRTGSIWKMYAVVPATAVWVNLHGSGVLAPLFVALFLAGDLLNKWSHRFFMRFGRERLEGKIPLPHVLLLLVLVFLATLVNPVGIHIWQATSEAQVVHFSGFAINTEWQKPNFGDFPLFYVSLAIFLIIASLSIQKLDFSQFFITFFLSLISLLYLRMIGLFFFALPFMLGVHLPHAGISRKGKEFSHQILGSTFLPILAAIAVLFSGAFFILHNGIQEFGFGVKSGRFPIEACDFLEKNYKGEFLYNDVKFGGYLIWRFYPNRKVFVDGRNELYASILERISRGLNDYTTWKDMLQEYNIDGALVSYWPELKGVIYGTGKEGKPPQKGFRAYSAFLFQKKEWALVYWDDLTMVFMKRNAENDEAIRKYEYKYLNPEDWKYLLSRSRDDQILKERILEEIVRRMDQEPHSKKASLLYEQFGKVSLGLPGKSSMN